jgi:adenosylhomocysteine nucleosidase
LNTGPIVFLTALDLEYNAVRERLTGLRLHQHRAGTRFEVGGLAGSSRCRVALGLVGKGNHPAAVLAERAIAEFDPAALLFVGIAGALWPGISIGDVIVATHVYAYHGGTSEDDGLKARPRVWEVSHECDQIARHVARTGSWVDGPPAGAGPPQVRFGPVAAGEIVQDSAISEHARWVREKYNDALAIEMEAAGVAQAGHLNRSLPVMVVRGISDRADGTKAATDSAHCQPLAAANAAAFAAALAGEMVHFQSGGGAVGSTRKARAMGEIHNEAKDNAIVGFQAGQVHGNVSIGVPSGPKPDLLTEIADLRQRLRRARETGELDAATCDAADEELAVVTESVRRGGPHATRTMVALKKLRGLIIDVGDLATRVTAIIAAVQALS